MICVKKAKNILSLRSGKAKLRTDEVRFAKAETHVNVSGVSDRLELKEFQDRLAAEAIQLFVLELTNLVFNQIIIVNKRLDSFALFNPTFTLG